MFNWEHIISGEESTSTCETLLEDARPTNNIKAFSWLKILLCGAFKTVIEKTYSLSVSFGKQHGQLGYNAQYPYMQKGLKEILGDDSILVHDGETIEALLVKPTLDEDTIIVNDTTIVHPVREYIMTPFVISTTRPLIENGVENGYRERIAATANKIRLTGTIPIIITRN